MRRTKRVLGWPALLALAALGLVSCEWPMDDFDLDGVGDFEIIPDGNPTWTGGGGWGWTDITPRNDLAAAAASDFRFVAVGKDILVSEDASQWRTAVADSTLAWEDVIWTGRSFIAVGSNKIMISDSGLVWETAWSGVENGHLLSIASYGNRIVACGWQSSPSTGLVLVSGDGIAWEEQSIAGPADWWTITKVVTAGSNGFLAVGINGDSQTQLVMRSADGGTWTLDTVSVKVIRDIVWDGARYVAASDSQLFLVSADASTWITIPETPVSMVLGSTSLAWSGSEYLCLRWGRVSHSTDAWVWQSTLTLQNWMSGRRVRWCRDRFLLFGRDLLSSSPDGVVWQTLTLP